MKHLRRFIFLLVFISLGCDNHQGVHAQSSNRFNKNRIRVVGVVQDITHKDYPNKAGGEKSREWRVAVEPQTIKVEEGGSIERKSKILFFIASEDELNEVGIDISTFSPGETIEVSGYFRGSRPFIVRILSMKHVDG